MVKNLPAMWETWIQSLDRKDPLEEGMATHSSILVWSMPWTEEPGRLQSIQPHRAGHGGSDLAHMHAYAIDTFGLWCWTRLLGVPWMARRSNQSIPKEINPEYSLEGLMLKLKIQYFDQWM